MYDIELFRYKYVGICAGIKVISFLISSFDWWLIRRRHLQEKNEGGLTVGEVVNSLVSLDKIFDPSPGDLEEGYHGVPGDSNASTPTHKPLTSSESTPVHHGMSSPAREPMIAQPQAHTGT